MTITITEKPESRTVTTGDSPSTVLRFTIRGTADDGEAKAALFNGSPPLYGGLVRVSHDVDPIFVDIENPAGSLWVGVVHYGRRREEPETGTSAFSFNLAGGTQHITQSKQCVRKYARPGYALPEKLGGAIGWDGSSVQGVDIVVPVYNWTERHYLPLAYVTDSYTKALFVLTGKVNNAGFRTFEPGEVLFMGASGSQRGQEDWEIAFSFAASPNLWNESVGDITGIRKGGWEYLWVYYKQETDPTAKKVVPVPEYVLIERVYDSRDFSRIGIGT